VRRVKRVGGAGAGTRAAADGRLREVKRRALEALSRADLDSVYDAARLESGDTSIDTAMKVLLAEKLADNIARAQRYARKARMKRVGASAILIAAQENRW
jgi:hypothetical protein